MRITGDLDDDVRAAIDALREQRGATFKEIVNEALRRGFPEQSAAREAKSQKRRRPKSA
jgi:hypothetical protein